MADEQLSYRETDTPLAVAERIRDSAHANYLEHGKNAPKKPDPKAAAKADVSKTVTLTGTVEVTANETASPPPQATESLKPPGPPPFSSPDRAMVLAEREAAPAKRFAQRAVVLLVSFWLTAPAGALISDYITRTTGWAVFTWLGVLPLAIAMTALSVFTARALQLYNEAGKRPDEIPYLAHLSAWYEQQQQYLGQSWGTPDEVGRRMRTWHLQRREGISHDDARRDWPWYRGLYVGVIVLLLLIILSLNTNGGETRPTIDVLVALLPAAILLFMLLPMSTVALGYPEFPDQVKANESKAEQVEADLKKGEISLKREEVISTNNDRQAEYEEASKVHAVTLSQLRMILVKAADRWETLRGFDSDEMRRMRAERQHLKRWKLISGIASVMMMIPATYPASISIAELFGWSPNFVPGLGTTQFSFTAWALCLIMVGVAEILLTSFAPGRYRINYSRQVLAGSYREQNRKHGMTYLILSEEEDRQQWVRTTAGVATGFVILGLELLANISYMVHVADGGNAFERFVLAFIPITIFIGLAMLLVNQSYRLLWLDEALGWHAETKASTANVSKKAPAVAPAKAERRGSRN